MRHLVKYLDPEGPYAQLHKWDGMLGFRGHFSTKSRRYSVTLGSLRGARRRWRLNALLEKTKTTVEAAADEILVIGSWAYAGMGWLTEGDKALADEAANAAREWRNDKARTRSQAHERRAP